MSDTRSAFGGFTKDGRWADGREPLFIDDRDVDERRYAVREARTEARETGPVNAAGRAAAALQEAGEYRRASADPKFAETAKEFKDHAREQINEARTARNTGAPTMDQSTAKTEIAHAKHDLKEARQEDIWQQAIEIGRQTQMAEAGQRKEEKQTETDSPRMAP